MATTIMSSIRVKPPRGRDERAAVRNCMVPLCQILAQFDPGQTAAVYSPAGSVPACAEDVVAVDASAALDLVGFEHEKRVPAALPVMNELPVAFVCMAMACASVYFGLLLTAELAASLGAGTPG